MQKCVHRKITHNPHPSFYFNGIYRFGGQTKPNMKDKCSAFRSPRQRHPSVRWTCPSQEGLGRPRCELSLWLASWCLRKGSKTNDLLWPANNNSKNFLLFSKGLRTDRFTFPQKQSFSTTTTRPLFRTSTLNLNYIKLCSNWQHLPRNRP